MKRLVLLSLVFGLSSFAVFAQNDGLEDSSKRSVEYLLNQTEFEIILNRLMAEAPTLDAIPPYFTYRYTQDTQESILEGQYSLSLYETAYFLTKFEESFDHPNNAPFLRFISEQFGKYPGVIRLERTSIEKKGIEGPFSLCQK